jgi:hypothetical protein
VGGLRKIPGKVVDIRTGQSLGRTRDLNLAFTNHIQHLLETEITFYLVHGPCRHQDVRVLVNDLTEALSEVPIVYDRQMKPDTVWIFEGYPEELGFAV